YTPLVTPLCVLLIAAIASSVASASVTRLAKSPLKHLHARMNMGVALLTIVLALPCIALWGAIGAALATALAQLCLSVGSIVTCRMMLFPRTVAGISRHKEML